jgi:hypothetical protein
MVPLAYEPQTIWKLELADVRLSVVADPQPWQGSARHATAGIAPRHVTVTPPER